MALSPSKRAYGFLPVLPREGRGGAVQRIQDLIRNAIVRLELPPGALIDKPSLCTRLGVSRFPVSEALGRLADEGFVEILPQRGTRVARIDMADCRQAMFIRRALEADAVRAIAGRVEGTLLARLQRNLRKQRAAMRVDDRPQFHELDLDFHKTLLDEFYRVAFRKKLYRSIAELQKDLDAWLAEYNNERPHQGRWCYGKTPMETFIDTLPVAKEKLMQAA